MLTRYLNVFRTGLLTRRSLLAPDVWHDVAAKDSVRVTYAQAARRVEQLAWGLINLGVKPGDRIGIAMRNFPECELTSVQTDVDLVSNSPFRTFVTSKIPPACIILYC